MTDEPLSPFTFPSPVTGQEAMPVPRTRARRSDAGQARAAKVKPVRKAKKARVARVLVARQPAPVAVNAVPREQLPLKEFLQIVDILRQLDPAVRSEVLTAVTAALK